ncbi:helix-turn-helix transcriptional regulator [uncultured Cedecea sp.]|uniref:helix-turn-helix transcriptional regulator n=1 Tax=uncultured Cedecea sp. TaxID=988762 RepID=UPI0026072437|nr:helix-turn-helix transcriptional regulator [uncultured Cedecea sp.]
MASVHDFHQNIVDELFLWIAQQPDKPISISLVAERAGFSRWHFQRMFKKHTGMTLGRYIKNIRLDQAIVELITGDDPIIFIALQYGYESQQTFTRAIKSYTGMNPGEIRRLSDEQKMSLLK